MLSCLHSKSKKLKEPAIPNVSDILKEAFILLEDDNYTEVKRKYFTQQDYFQFHLNSVLSL